MEYYELRSTKRRWLAARNAELGRRGMSLSQIPRYCQLPILTHTLVILGNLHFCRFLPPDAICRTRYFHGKSSVCMSVRLSVCNVEIFLIWDIVITSLKRLKVHRKLLLTACMKSGFLVPPKWPRLSEIQGFCGFTSSTYARPFVNCH